MASGEDGKSFADMNLAGIEVLPALIEENFRDACSRGDVEALKLTVQGCTREEVEKLLTAQSTCTGTPLFEAVMAQQPKVVQYMLELGVDLEMLCEINVFYPICFRDRCTALCLACAGGDVEICRSLLEAGACVNHTSQHSSPMIYASEYNNVALMSLLLEYGADVNIVPQSLQTEVAVLPLYQACLMGHKDTAELLMYHSNVDLDPDKRMCLMGLLGAQCINKHQDYEAGLKFWKQALQELEVLNPGDCKGASAFVESDLATKLQSLYIKEASKAGSSTVGISLTSLTGEIGERSPYSIFKDMKLCTTMEELDRLAEDENALNFQGLLVLESILGPSHAETTQQVSQAARVAFEHGDLCTACRLFLYIIESNQRRNFSITAQDYMSQLVDLLLNTYTAAPEHITKMDNIVGLLLAALDMIQEGAHDIYNCLAVGFSEANPSANPFESQLKSHSKVKMLSEMVENFMGLSRLLIDQTMSKDNMSALCQILQKFLELRDHQAAYKYGIEPELFKIAVYGGRSATSTLHYFQEELFPDHRILHLLLQCGANVNCQDSICGDTPLHFSIDCPQPNLEIIKVLLAFGGHVDIYNRYGVTPYSLLSRIPQPGIQPFHYVTLKCLASRIIVNLGINYKDQVPKSLEEFIPWHGLAKTRSPIRKTVSADELCTQLN